MTHTAESIRKTVAARASLNPNDDGTYTYNPLEGDQQFLVEIKVHDVTA